MDEDQQRKKSEQLALEKDLNEIRAKEAGASKQFSDAEQRVRDIEEKIKEIEEGRSLSKFILERVQADDYRKYLGIISSVRRDFEKLDKLLPRTLNLGPTAGVVRVDRIILYIDDLDRCPEDKVVEVLQAIHLLLAFKLFVVVVGVDSRWLLHSLREQSSVFRNVPESGRELASFDFGHWRSTPLNYLEKIFQIPFALRPMSKTGFERLVENLTEQLSDGDQAASGKTPADRAQQGPAPMPEPAEPSGAATPPPEASQVSSPLPSVSVMKFDPNPEPLRLKDCERKFMWNFRPLIPSPRAAKRFANTYRLVRASLSVQELGAFVHDDGTGAYQVVQLLLAIQTGYPEQAMRIIGDLIENKPTGPWRAFIESYRRPATPANGTVITPVVNPADPSEEALKAETWREFIQRLERVSPEVFAIRSCDEFAQWGARVARYSFQSARVLPFAVSDQ